LADLLVKKGIIRQEELGDGPVTRDALVKLLVKKGVIREDELQADTGASSPYATKAEVAALQNQVQAAISEAPASGATEMPKWLKGFNLKGDVRFRYEGFSYQDSDAENRTRVRIRARLGMDKKYENGVATGVRLATGALDDPISTNQTLGDDMTNKSLNLDRAYIAYQPEFAEWFWITAGRFENPFLCTPLVWDGDLNMDGVAEKFTVEPMEGLSVYGLAGQLMIDEVSGGPDAWLWAWQGGGTYHVTEEISADLGIAFYKYQNTSDIDSKTSYDAVKYGNSGSKEDVKLQTTTEGTSVKFADLRDGELLFDYHVMDIVGKVTATVMERPLSVFFDYAVNLADDTDDEKLEENKAWCIGAKFGQLKEENDFEVFIDYRWIEADSVLAAFNDSDFLGTNRKGVVFGGGWMARKNIQLNTAIFVTEDIDEEYHRQDDYVRWQVDATVKF
jgi:hypothetical protein